MHDTSYSTTTVQPRHGVLRLTGYGIRVAVERGHLIVEDGRGKERRRARFPRTTRDLKRLVVLGHAGTVSFDALRWLSDVGCAFVQIDTDGQLIAASGLRGLDDARLRRAQALASGNDTGAAIARELLIRKLNGQADVLERMVDAHGAASRIRRYRDELAATDTLTGLRVCEGQAARVYWEAWGTVPVRFARRMQDRVPDHWKVFGTRSSPLTGSPRTAANPPNAMLNYLYTIAEAECRIALLAVGLDPGLGIVHADQKNRDSLALDVMETIRPDIDAFVLDLLRSRPFGPADVFERRDGCCRLMPPITSFLAETGPRWQELLGLIVEGVAQALMASGPGRTPRQLATPLTQANRSAGRAKVRRRNAPSGQSYWITKQPATPPAACHECGTILDNPARQYCDKCFSEIRNEQERTFVVAGQATLARRRAAGTDPAHGGGAGCKRGRSNAKHHRAIDKWKRINPGASNAEWFTQQILPGLQDVPLSVMAEATGLTEGYCSFIRRGIKVPHQRHWRVLEQVVETCHNPGLDAALAKAKQDE